MATGAWGEGRARCGAAGAANTGRQQQQRQRPLRTRPWRAAWQLGVSRAGAITGAGQHREEQRQPRWLDKQPAAGIAARMRMQQHRSQSPPTGGMWRHAAHRQQQTVRRSTARHGTVHHCMQSLVGCRGWCQWQCTAGVACQSVLSIPADAAARQQHNNRSAYSHALCSFTC